MEVSGPVFLHAVYKTYFSLLILKLPTAVDTIT